MDGGVNKGTDKRRLAGGLYVQLTVAGCCDSDEKDERLPAHPPPP
jgi:hypothetical protein